MPRRPLIIDADPGCDDAQAFMLVCGSGMFDVKAVCAVHGNVGLEDTSRNALYLAGLCGLECPVCKGAEQAILARKERAAYAHGGNGLAGLDYTVDMSRLSDKKPWDVMYEEAVNCGGELEILAVGPLTNVALAVLRHPDLPSMVKQLTIMGGGATRGNTSPYAEFNIAQDPHALQILLEAGFERFVMVDLDCCGTAYVKEEELDFRFLDPSNPWQPLYYQMDAFHKARQIPAELAKRMGLRKEHFACDAVAAFVLAHPEHAVLEERYVACETRSSLSAGQTVVDWDGRSGRKPNVLLARSADRDAYAEFYLRCLNSFDGRKE